MVSRAREPAPLTARRVDVDDQVGQMCFRPQASGYQSLMYWREIWHKEIPAATVSWENGAFFHRRGADTGEEHREGDLHPVLQLADTHGVTAPASEVFTDG